jgi:hypothetical protein
MMLDRYRPSGFFRPTVILLFVAAAAGGVLAAWLYQLLVHWIPFIYINLFICLGFGAVIGVLGGMAVRRGHCRNPILALVLALPLAGSAVSATYYWDYRSTVSTVAKETNHTADEVKQELSFRDYLQVKQEVGWKVKSTKMTGVFVLITWGIEAVLIFFMALWLTVGAAREPYCERCNAWCRDDNIAVAGIGRAEVDPLVARGDLATLVKVQSPADPNPLLSVTLEITHCPSCRDAAYLTVTEKQIVHKKKGKPEEKTKTLVRWAVLSGSARSDALTRLSPQPPAQRIAV